METLGERLRFLRMEKGYTQKELHAELGMVEKTIQNHESGKTRPPQSQIERYWRFYKCSYEWLVTGKGEYKQTEEHMFAHKDHVAPDSGPGQPRIPEFDKYQVVQVIGSENEEMKAISTKLDRILDLVLRHDREIDELKRREKDRQGGGHEKNGVSCSDGIARRS